MSSYHSILCPRTQDSIAAERGQDTGGREAARSRKGNQKNEDRREACDELRRIICGDKHIGAVSSRCLENLEIAEVASEATRARGNGEVEDAVGEDGVGWNSAALGPLQPLAGMVKV